MDTLDALSCRLTFNGLPLGEVQRIISRVEHGASWLRACLRTARGMRELALQSEREGHVGSTRDAWLLTAAALQAASFCIHFKPGGLALRHARRVRQLARIAYQRALAVDCVVGEAVEVPFEGGLIHGYLRRPRVLARAPVVVLLNGLDSICEVEMHAFGTWLQSRGLVTLALDLPADGASAKRRPLLEVERAAHAIASFIRNLDGVREDRCGLFGVSLGGYLVSRLLTSGIPFHCGVAVSPPAALRRSELPAPILAMLAWSFNAGSDRDIDELTARVNTDTLPALRGKILLIQMEHDRLFDNTHTEAIVQWGGSAVELRRVEAEHVGTSAFHKWLPLACDWLQGQLQ
jgi:dienelactone hydrolase